MSQGKSRSEPEADTNVLVRRIVAVVVDTALLTVALAALAAPFLIPTWVVIIAAAVGQLAYFLLFEGLFSLTPGKFLTGIRVAREDGSTIDFRDSAMRNLIRFIDSALSYSVGLVFVLRSENNQRLGDRYANTVVVKR